LAHPLDGARAKIGRAAQQFECVEAKIASSAFDPEAVTFSQEFNVDTSTIEVSFQGLPEEPLPVEWGLITADALQNLRVALNYLAWELAAWNLARSGASREPTEKTQFPICTPPGHFDSWRVQDLDPRHVALIKGLQPNAPGHIETFDPKILAIADDDHLRALAATHPLAELQRLTNIDKHRVLQPTFVVSEQLHVAGVSSAIDCIVRDINISPPPALENGAHWSTLQVTVTGPEPKVQVEDRVVPEIAFGGWPIRRKASAILTEVRRVVGVFEPTLQIGHDSATQSGGPASTKKG
jgi:hypothetical protein